MDFYDSNPDISIIDFIERKKDLSKRLASSEKNKKRFSDYQKQN